MDQPQPAPEPPDDSPPHKRGLNDEPAIRLSVPWESGASNIAPQSIIGYSDASAMEFVKERSRVHQKFIEEREKTKRLQEDAETKRRQEDAKTKRLLEDAKTKRWGLLISALLGLGGGVILIFAPDGKQAFANWIGATLFVVAGGAAGYKRIWFKSKGINVGAEGKS